MHKGMWEGSELEEPEPNFMRSISPCWGSEAALQTVVVDSFSREVSVESFSQIGMTRVPVLPEPEAVLLTPPKKSILTEHVTGLLHELRLHTDGVGPLLPQSHLKMCMLTAGSALEHLTWALDNEKRLEAESKNDRRSKRKERHENQSFRPASPAILGLDMIPELAADSEGKPIHSNGEDASKRIVLERSMSEMSNMSSDDTPHDTAAQGLWSTEVQVGEKVGLESECMNVSRRKSLVELSRSQNLDSHKKGTVVSSSNTWYIDPEKPFRLGWDATSLLLILSLMVLIPVEMAFFYDSDAPVVLEVYGAMVDYFFIADIFLNFCTAYHEGHGVSGRLVTHFKGIAVHYLKTWFIIDFLAAFPWSALVNLFAVDGEGSSGAAAKGMIRVLKYAKLARMMKVLRVLKLGGLMQVVEEKMVAAQSMTVAFQLIKMLVCMVLLCHIVACGFYAMANFDLHGEGVTWLSEQGMLDSMAFHQYIAAFYFAIATGTTVGYGDIHPCNPTEQATTIFVLILSVGYFGQCLGKVPVIVASLRHNEALMMQAKREAILFMKRKAVPKELQFRVVRYLEHVHETDALTSLDAKIMDLLSNSLRNELALTVTGSVLKTFPLFEDVEEAVLTWLCQECKTSRAGVGDIVVAEDQTAHEMYWVVRGEAAVFRKDKQVGGLKPGDWFGELALFFPGAVRSATVMCETHCEFFVLHHEQFQKVIESFPKVKKAFVKITAELQQGNPCGLKLRCPICGSREHFSKNCPRAKKDRPS